MQNYYQRPPFRQPYQGREQAGQKACQTRPSKKDPETKFAVAMAYVPWQRGLDLYPICKGFVRGTIFEELDKPFLGKGGCCS
nr:spore coat associated protein CotJA [uncultured Sellimonas sp.]